jgi:hemerythrin-like domain-containing protein
VELYIQTLRQQHDELLALVHSMTARLRSAQLARSGVEMRKFVATLAAKLRIHAAIEDRVLYPQLSASADSEIRDVALAFASEMGSLWADFEGYVAHWPHHASIQERPEIFVQETRAVLELLSRRIERENAELYRLIESRVPSQDWSLGASSTKRIG